MNYHIQTMIEKLSHEANLESIGFRRALRSAIVVFLSVIIYHVFSLTQGYWVTMTAVIVVQATVGATLRKGFQRFLGTLLGVMIASLLLLWIHDRFMIEILMILFLFFTYFFNPYTSNLINYGFIMIPLSIMVVFLIALTNPEKINAGLVYARFYDTVIGAALGVLGSLFLFPNKTKGEFNTSKEYLQKQLADYFLAIMDMFLNRQNADIQAKAKKRQVEYALLSDRQFCLERRYETHFRFSQHEIEKRFLEVSERMAQRLFSLHQQARYHLSPEIFEEMVEILIQLRDKGFEFLSKEAVSEEALLEILQLMQKHLAEIRQRQDNITQHWQDIAPFAGLHFVITGLIQDIKQARDGQQHSV